MGFTNQNEVTKRMSFISLDTSSAWPISIDGKTPIDTGDNLALLHNRRDREDDDDESGGAGLLPEYISAFLTKETLYESISSEDSDNE